MTLEMHPIRLDHESDTEGMLVMREGRLTAILTKLSDTHGDRAGEWFVECAFGLSLDSELCFADLDQAKIWLAAQLEN